MAAAPRDHKPTVLLLDLYEWTDAYPADHPLRNVTAWFARQLPDERQIQLLTAGVNDDFPAAARGVDAVIISGSPRDAWVDDPVNDRVLAVISDCRRTGIPVLGVCFGHQILGRALGAKVGPHPAGYELGNVEVRLTEDGARAPLFEGMPGTLDVIESHLDAVLELPPGARLLATGAHTAIQAFDYDGTLLGVQFHPEMDPAVLQFVWGESRRAAWRSRMDFNLDERLAGLQPTPVAATVLRNFIRNYVS